MMTIVRSPAPAGTRVPSSGARLALALALALLLAGCGTTRALRAESDRIAEVLRLAPGMQVADVGAGEGRWCEHLAGRVGEAGHVYATEISEDLVEKIRGHMREADLHNVTPVLGQAFDTGLEDGCCDAILLRLTYHHFTDPGPMRASLWRAMRPGGLLAIIEISPQKLWPRVDGVQERGGHGISPEDLIEEMASEGFQVVSRHDEWEGPEDRYCIVFQR